MKEVFHKYKSNDVTEQVFIKVKVLDSFYSTNLKEGLDDMVKNITKVKNFNVLLKKDPIKLVNKIKNVKSTLHDTKECISFASKYCNRCNEKEFPIYDKYVKQMLCLIDRAKPFYSEESASDETDEKSSSKKSIKHLAMSEIDSYRYGFVINYNMNPVVSGAGSAIFFHVSHNSPTAGCVSVSEDKVLDYLAKLDKSKNPYILII